MKHKYMEMIAAREPVIFDGAMGTEIQKAEPSAEDFGGCAGCCEYLNISRPDIIEAIHVRYLEAGAHVIETNTFGGSRVKLDEFGLGARVYEINKAAAEVARGAIDKVSAERLSASGKDKGIDREIDKGINPLVKERPRFVCGSIGPTGFLPSSSDRELSAVTFDRLADIYEEQAAGLIDGGADILLIETSQDLLEVRAAVYGIRRLARSTGRYAPLQVQVTMDGGGKMLLGSDVSAFLGAVQGMGVDVVGLNCSSGPDEMAPFINRLLELSTLPVSMLPNAGLPHNVDGKAVYKMGAEEFAGKVSAFVRDKGVSVVGGCCGTAPEHIRALANALDGVKAAARGVAESGFSSDAGVAVSAVVWDNKKSVSPRLSCFLSTGISGVDLEQLPRPIIIGERLNTQGSKKTKEHVINHNYDELYHIANEQVNHSSNLIDICVAANELDVGEAEMMGSVVKFLSDRIAVPFCIDTTEPAVLEAALKRSPGSVLINSINLEHGGVKAREILAYAAGFGCPVIALTIDGAGMAGTAERKFEVARELRRLACEEYGLPEHYVYIDPLVFTLATGDAATAGAALETLEALRRIKKEFPNIRTAMGVSNVSFGLKPKARRVLNNLMLRYAVEAGLDGAIFNPLHVDDIGKYDPAIRGLADDLLLNRREDSLQRFVEHFESLSTSTSTSTSTSLPPPNKTSSGIDKKDIDASQPPEERLRLAVLNRDKRNLADIINKLLETVPAPDILNTVLLPAMSEVGDKMAAGEMILPFVLQAAEVMKESVSVLEPHLKDGAAAAKGKMVIATVYGDVHDIGKNLVASILRNQGFEVVDLGKQVSVDTIVEAARREKPDIVGLSALLVTTSQEMGKCVKEFARQGIDIPIVIGGAAVNKNFAAKISILEDGSTFAPGVHYAKDAFGVVRIFDDIRNGLSIQLPITPPAGLSPAHVEGNCAGLSPAHVEGNCPMSSTLSAGLSPARNEGNCPMSSTLSLNVGVDDVRALRATPLQSGRTRNARPYDARGVDFRVHKAVQPHGGVTGAEPLSPKKEFDFKKDFDVDIDVDVDVDVDFKKDFDLKTPPFQGTGEILTWSVNTLLPSGGIEAERLFKAWWGGGNLKSKEDYTRARIEEFEPVFERLSAEVIKDSLVDARAYYGFFPVISEGERLVILDPSDNITEALSFVFPRMPKSGVSLADYIRPEGDVLSVQAVTIGARLGDRCRALLLDHDRYSDGYYLNGLGGYLTEAVADRVSAEIRRALSLSKNDGRRYSFGYHGMPDLSEQARLLEYIGVEERLGITLTPGFQMRPEHSTVAIFIHHPDAQYIS